MTYHTLRIRNGSQTRDIFETWEGENDPDIIEKRDEILSAKEFLRIGKWKWMDRNRNILELVSGEFES